MGFTATHACPNCMEKYGLEDFPKNKLPMPEQELLESTELDKLEIRQCRNCHAIFAREFSYGLSPQPPIFVIKHVPKD